MSSIETEPTNKPLLEELGIGKLARVEENIASAEIDLSADELNEIDAAAAKISIQGDRYPEELERMTYK